MVSTTISVTLSPTARTKVTLPPSIAAIWARDLYSTVLIDIYRRRFGPQRHVFELYTLVYRLDILPNVLQKTVQNFNTAADGVVEDIPQFSEALEMAKVWLTFDEESLQAS